MRTDSSASFGALLKRFRQTAGLSQEELAERAGLSPRGVSDLERGARTQPRPGTVRLLADALNLTDADRAAFFTAALGTVTPVPDSGATISPASPASPHAPSAAPPTGTVTFLFTDIEGSTRLLQRLGPRYAEVLDEHRRLLREAFAAHRGYEVDTQGDSFFVAFPTAQDASMTAVEATRALAAHPWPEDAPARVRIGLHTGAPQLVGNRYVGLDVHRAARIAAAGHGGQILLSEAAAGLVRADLPDGVTLRDLGAHRLKDLQQPERIYQLVLPDLPADFPALKSLDARPHNLPVQLTPLIGREREVAQIVALLGRQDVRLVTITGPGAVGKTRLSVQVAAELLDAFPDGVWNVRLSRLSDPALVAPTIATTLGLKESGALPLADVLRNSLRDKRLLLVLDNFEQVIRAALAVTELLSSCPGVKALVTSRAPLRVQSEHEYALHPLALPDSAHPPLPDQLSQYAAVALFIERAQAAWAEFAVTNANAPAVAAICERLDGLPLAIELAAARVKVLPPPALLKRLERSLPVLTGGARDLDERQQTMRNTLAWSYDFLAPEEKRLFCRLAVFVGGCTLEAAEAVCVAPEGAELLDLDLMDGLQALVDHSLIQQREEGGEPRFGMLHVIREYALELLKASGEEEELRWEHAAYFLALAEQSEPHLFAREQLEWLDRLERDHDNLRAMLGWAVEQSEVEIGLRLGGAAWPLWHLHSHFREGRRWFEALLALPEPRVAVPAPTRGRALLGLGVLAYHLGDQHASAGILREAIALLRDQPQSAAAGLALFYLGYYGDEVLRDRGEQAHVACEEARAIGERAGDEYVVGLALVGLGTAAIGQADWEAAVRLHEDGLKVLRTVGERYALGLALMSYGSVLTHRSRPGDIERCIELQEQSLAISSELGSRDLQVSALDLLGTARCLQGDSLRARATLEQARTLAQEIGDRGGLWFALRWLGEAAMLEGDYGAARVYFKECFAVGQDQFGGQEMAVARLHLGMVALDTGDLERAHSLLRESTAALHSNGARRLAIDGVRELAGLAAAWGRSRAAARLLEAAQHLREQLGHGIPPADRPRYELRFAALREQLGQLALAAAVAEGRTLSYEEAIAEALSDEAIAVAPGEDVTEGREAGA